MFEAGLMNGSFYTKRPIFKKVKKKIENKRHLLTIA